MYICMFLNDVYKERRINHDTTDQFLYGLACECVVFGDRTCAWEHCVSGGEVFQRLTDWQCRHGDDIRLKDGTSTRCRPVSKITRLEPLEAIGMGNHKLL
jgi:hypothetical protein